MPITIKAQAMSASSPLSSIFIRAPFLPCFLDGHKKSETAPINSWTVPRTASLKYELIDILRARRRPSEYQILCLFAWFDMYLAMALTLSHRAVGGWTVPPSPLVFLSLSFWLFFSIDGYDLATPSQPWACGLESKSAETDPQNLMGHLTTPLVDFQLQHW